MRYRVTLEKDGAGWFASIPDVPEALTSAQTIHEALTMAKDALITAMDFYFEDGRPVPPPGPIGDRDYTVDLPASLWIKVILLNEMLAQKKRPTDLAHLLGAKRQDVQRLFDLGHPTKIDTVERTLAALGKRLVMTAQ